MKWRALLLGLLLQGCAGAEDAKPTFDATVGYEVRTGQPQLVAVRGQSEASVIVDAAWLSLGTTELHDREQSEVVAVPALGALDHLDSRAKLRHVELRSDARYCDVSLAFRPADSQPSAAPAELVGHSILLTGTREGVAFRLASTLDTRIAPLASCFRLEEDYGGMLFVFDLTVWLRDLPWSKAETDAGGTLVIDGEHSPEFRREFEARLGRGIELYADTDRDGRLDADWIPLGAGEGV